MTRLRALLTPAVLAFPQGAGLFRRGIDFAHDGAVGLAQDEDREPFDFAEVARVKHLVIEAGGRGGFGLRGRRAFAGFAAGVQAWVA